MQAACPPLAGHSVWLCCDGVYAGCWSLVIFSSAHACISRLFDLTTLAGLPHKAKGKIECPVL